MAAAQLVSRVIIGMAGHVDHGKSALVTALTGHPMDRLAEERRRGITVDLHFAPLELEPGVTAGIIDVPGHEDFVRTMVAGASGVDVALLVIAGDEGIMPQTREHLMALEQLQVLGGIAVLTKADATDPDWLELVKADVTEWLGHSSIRFGEVAVTSAVTGAGITDLKSRLAELGTTLRVRDPEDLFRMPIDRVFSVAGAGTVVTGTSISGSVGVGAHARLLPSGREVRVRSIESHGTSLERSLPGWRTAVALSGVERDDITRGDVLVLATDAWEVTTRLDAELSLGREAGAALTDRSRVRVHHGTAEVMARVRLDAPLEAGASGVARLNLEAPIVARGDDRFVLRSYSPMSVIGGGRVVDPLPGSRHRTPIGLSSLDPAVRLDALVARRRHGIEASTLPVLLGMPSSACAALLQRSTGLLTAGGLVLRRELVERLASSVVRQVEAFHAREPHEPGISVETLRHSLRVPEPIAAAALARALESGRIMTAAGTAALPGFQAETKARGEELARLVAAVRDAGLAAPGAAELAASLRIANADARLREAARAGDIVLVEPGRYVSTEALERFAVMLREVGAGGVITPAAVRDRSGLSRKYLIPLLEWADRSGITRRDGDGRLLRTPGGGIPGGA